MIKFLTTKSLKHNSDSFANKGGAPVSQSLRCRVTAQKKWDKAHQEAFLRVFEETSVRFDYVVDLVAEVEAERDGAPC